MMGLAVALGWSFFVQKQAQSAADAAALAAVTEAYQRMSATGTVVSAFTCASSGTGATSVDCEGQTDCTSVVATSNLNNGCQYALKNGFDWTNSRQRVTIQSSDGQTGNLPVTSPGVINITYWATVRTTQTIPQLFSAVGGNREGTVSAVATGAIAASVGPGSFYGMNRAGDCTNSADGHHCGTDISTGTGQGGSSCPAPYSNVNGSVCAPAGIVLSSTCNSVQAGRCDDGVAGTGTGAGVAGGSLTILNTGIVSGDYHNMSNQTLTAVNQADSDTFQDFYKGKPQIPLQASNANGPVGACGYPNGTIPTGVTTLGPYQYYSFNPVTGAPDGKPIVLPDGVTFSTSQAGCPGTGAVYTAGAGQSSTFPSYIFWGGLFTNSTATFGAGQYVMAGTIDSSASGAVFSIGGAVNGNGQTSITGDTATGTNFIFTDGNYPGLAAQKAIIPSGNLLDNAAQGTTLYQGTLAFKNSTVNLTGMVNSKNVGSNLPPALDVYGGIAWWQDRRNSYADGYNEASGLAGCTALCTGDNGTVIYCATGGDCADPSTSDLNTFKSANHVTATSAGVTLQPGNVTMNMSGAFYQPRGAWLYIKHGTGTLGGPLQVVTGALIEDTGDTNLLLTGPTNPIITYKPILIH
jgi:Flp pilus assembly protein TadG